jgi:hypothetical protein
MTTKRAIAVVFALTLGLLAAGTVPAHADPIQNGRHGGVAFSQYPGGAFSAHIWEWGLVPTQEEVEWYFGGVVKDHKPCQGSYAYVSAASHSTGSGFAATTTIERDLSGSSGTITGSMRSSCNTTSTAFRLTWSGSTTALPTTFQGVSPGYSYVGLIREGTGTGRWCWAPGTSNEVCTSFGTGEAATDQAVDVAP